MNDCPTDLNSREAADAAVEAAFARHRAGDLRYAHRVYHDVLRRYPGHARALHYLGLIAGQTGRPDEALRLIDQSAAADPANSSVHNDLAACLEQQGRYAEAVEHYEAAVRIDPLHGKSIARLIALHDFDPPEGLLENARKLVRDAAAEPATLAKLHGALGKRADKRGAYDEAFDHFARANQCRDRYGPPYDARGLEEFFGALIGAFRADAPVPFDTIEKARIAPIFIVGMPRSGTTLAEQILASHPEVFGAGELQGVPALAASLGPEYPARIQQQTPARLEALRRRYLERLDALAPDGARYVTDKLPLNFIHLGLIALLFPEARIVHCRRDPRDVALSCFIEQFDMPQDFSTKLDNFAVFYSQYRRLMAHWRKSIRLPVFDLGYESLVLDQEMETRKLIAFCALDWNEDCLNYRNAARPVLTPSHQQVRQPIYRSAIGRWKNYESHLQPLMRLLNIEERKGL